MRTTCSHCRSPIEDAAAPAGYCCFGCAAVASLLTAQGLTRYYDLQNSAVGPVSLPARTPDLSWLEQPLSCAREDAHGGVCRLDVDVQGIRCSACVWLMAELFRRQDGALEALVNPAVGRVTLSFRPETDVGAWVRALEQLGYRAGPPRKDMASDSDRVLTRLGLCVALTMNSMMFTIAHYAGMTPRDGEVFSLMRWLNLALSALVVWIGGREFFARTVSALRVGVVPFDLPIALGLSLAFAGSTWVFIREPSSFSYFDTVNTFTTLMLVGRWLQERVLERNRRQLLAHDGLEGLYARRVTEGRVENVLAARIQRSDTLLVPPGGLMVVDGALLDDDAVMSLDWINGESEPRTFARGDRVPAGSFNTADRAVRATALCDFAESTLVPLLGRGPAEDASRDDDPLMLRRLTRLYVPFVLLSSVATFLAWCWRDLDRAIASTTAVLVVTCPCALGLAIPLAYQRITAQLRAAGLFVRRGGFLDRAAAVRRVVFDKTGTLTLGQLSVATPDVLRTLPDALGRALYNMTARSTHPRARAVHAAMPPAHQVFDDALTVREEAGRGLCAHLADGRVVKLGSAAYALPGTMPTGDEDCVWLSVDGVTTARIALKETLRWDARAELHALRTGGYAVTILSGDAPARVGTIAAELGLDGADAVGGLSPHGKADWLCAHGGVVDALLVGDGVNDHPGFGAALCSGTPAVEHPALSSRADFYFLTAGLGVVRTALDAARVLRLCARRVRTVALAYNVLSVGACLAGVMTPLMAAVAMPTSSILILLFTIRSTRLQRVPSSVPPSLAGRPAEVLP